MGERGRRMPARDDARPGSRPETENGHDRFFATFGRFGAATHGRTGDMLAEVAIRAAEGGERYLEIMFTPDGGSLARLGLATGWDDDWGRLRQKLLDSGLRDTVKAASRPAVFAQILRGFEMAHSDPRVVGLNLVQPEGDGIPCVRISPTAFR